MKETVSRWAGWVLERTGFLRALLRFTPYWSLRRREGTLAFPFVERRVEQNFLILTYHQVNDDGDAFFEGVPTKTFARQMEVIQEYFNVLPLDELVERAAGNDVPPRGIAITFDDGYRDNYVNAFPVLKRHGMPATVFLVTGVLGNHSPIWHDRVFGIFRQTQCESAFLEGKQRPMRNIDEKRGVMNLVLARLRGLDPFERDSEIERLGQALGVPEPRHNPKLTWDEVREMTASGIAFGAHTVTHPILTKIPLGQAVQEIVASKEALEREVKRPVTLFAYPNGRANDFSAPIKRAVREAGFLCAVTTLWGANDRRTDFFELRRIGLWGDDPHVSALRLGWYGLSN